MNEPYFAHTRPDAPPADWQALKTHLEQTAGLAGLSAAKFGAESLGRLAGLLHDAGKYSQEFQRRLHGSKERVDHASAGARLAVPLHKALGKLLAYVIAGHHGGLPDAGSLADPGSLLARLDESQFLPDYSQFHREMTLPELVVPSVMPADSSRRGFTASFFTRMLYSCLVDADFRDTEAFCDPDRAKNRPVASAPWSELLTNLDEHLDRLATGAPDSPVNRVRAEVLEACRRGAAQPPGWFSLTVPTGGGKTLSSLAFALAHAAQHGLDRVIYTIPFTSIIEQNADVFRTILGKQAVLEHHSNYESPEAFGEDQPLYERLRLAAENWDAPVVVTTNVQFFESLFAAKPSRCRKLHNMARSVVILDEAQMLPLDYLRPCLAALAELVANYDVSVVLCTATQPALQPIDSQANDAKHLLPSGVQPVELASDPPALYERLRRVRVVNEEAMDDQALSARLAGHEQVLCIVNTRRHARELYQRIAGLEGACHLSARMCPAHRSFALNGIRAALKEGRPCRLVATQLIEAGVDIDFPVVYRAMAGIDSIAQAAGRCNREGKARFGEMHLFEPDQIGQAPGFLARTADVARDTLRRHPDPLAPEAVRDYFHLLYSLDSSGLDAKGILDQFERQARSLNFPFREVADQFRFIEQGMVSVIVAWDARAVALRDQALAGRLDDMPWRALQKYTVQIYPYEHAELVSRGAVMTASETFHFLVLDKRYDPQLGLLPGEAAVDLDVLLG